MNVQLRWVNLFLKPSWIKTTASGLSYELGVNGEKKVNGNWDIINKNGHIIDTVTLKLTEDESHCKKKCDGF